MSIIKHLESSGYERAESCCARGLYGVGKPALAEYNQKFGTSFTYDDLFVGHINALVGWWYMGIRIPQMLRYFDIEDTIENRLIAYNAGINYLVEKKRIPDETVEYLKRYALEAEGGIR